MRKNLISPLRTIWSAFEARLFSASSTDRLFNPYRDRHPELDCPDAPAIRRRNLWRYLAAYEAPPPVFLLAEAPGPWGCRFSGVPLTSEAQLLDPAFPLHGEASGQAGRPHREYSARIYWRVMHPYFPRFFTWSAVPLHPHRPGKPLSIRTPTQREVRDWLPLVAAIVEALCPRQVIAVGRKAEFALHLLGVPCTYVRHPSQGGARQFEVGVRALLEAL
ncbi:uracil-DNA glycosylase [Rhodothermus profundi]|uniref:Uracil DNA glycosylase superfamily protein n=1 Tax=Rhodothermus profundi TaxID=633813 RepID=A0A1M6W1W1_9BACT|nr:uracil-DNA glycosylase [Rhodothermus profundi]SHK87752.1 Uracil DNA glycosylase superfamily protein [Rhodothermus profundi]